MTTYTTINASKDTYLNERRNTQNFGGELTMIIGAAYSLGTFQKYNAVWSFDVSGITDLSSITKANLLLTPDSSLGTTTQTVTLARLNQDFVETEATWEISATGTSWSGGSGAFGSADTTLPTYTFSVGSGVVSAITIDIKDLVIDAIIRRSGTLLLIASIVGTPVGSAQGRTRFFARETTGGGHPPTLTVYQAERVVWSGEHATSGSMQEGANWVGGTKPDATDYAMFIEDGTNKPAATLTCERVYFGRLFSQDAGIGGIGGTPIGFIATSIFIDTKAQVSLLLVATEVIIRNAKDIISGCQIFGTITNLYISDCVAEVTIYGTITNTYIMSGNRMNPISNTYTGAEQRVIINESAIASNIICEGSYFVTDNAESREISLYGSGKYELNNTAEVNGIISLNIASDSVCYFNAKEIQTDLTMYGGTFTIEDNTNSQLDMPTTMTTINGTVNLDNGLDAANPDAFTGTTFIGYSATLAVGKTYSLAIQ